MLPANENIRHRALTSHFFENFLPCSAIFKKIKLNNHRLGYAIVEGTLSGGAVGAEAFAKDSNRVYCNLELDLGVKKAAESATH
jgi:hypothetical protein